MHAIPVSHMQVRQGGDITPDIFILKMTRALWRQNTFTLSAFWRQNIQEYFTGSAPPTFILDPTLQ